MANLQFTDWQCHDDRPTLSREEGIARTLGFAGIHDRDTLSWVYEAFSSGASDISTVSDYDFGYDEGTWCIDPNGSLSGTAPDGAQWYKILYYADEIGSNFTLTFDKTGDNGGVVLCSNTTYGSALLAWWTGTHVGFSTLAGAAETILLKLPCTEAGDATVTVSVWHRSYSKIDEVDDIAMGLWFDGHLVAQHVTTFYSSWDGYFGFAVSDTKTATFDDVRIPQLHQNQEWTSVDPGEAASAGLNRVTGQDMIRVQARYDGGVKIWRNVGTDVDWTPAVGAARKASKQHQFYSPSHLRLVGGVHEVNVFRDDLNQGHVFVVANDPHALDEEDTYDRAIRLHKKAEESADKLTLELVGLNVLLEPEDIIEYNGTKWRVQTIAYRIASQTGQGGGNVAVLDSTVQCRACLES